MKYFRLKYQDGTTKTVSGENSLEIIKKYDLATRENVNTRIIELSGEQAAIAAANNE